MRPGAVFRPSVSNYVVLVVSMAAMMAFSIWSLCNLEDTDISYDIQRKWKFMSIFALVVTPFMGGCYGYWMHKSKLEITQAGLQINSSTFTWHEIATVAMVTRPAEKNRGEEISVGITLTADVPLARKLGLAPAEVRKHCDIFLDVFNFGDSRTGGWNLSGLSLEEFAQQLQEFVQQQQQHGYTPPTLVATDVVPNTTPTLGLSAAFKLERDRKQISLLEDMHQTPLFQRLVNCGWMRWEDITDKNPPTTDPNHVSNPDGGDDPEYICNVEKFKRLQKACEEFVETMGRFPSADDPPYSCSLSPPPMGADFASTGTKIISPLTGASRPASPPTPEHQSQGFATPEHLSLTEALATARLTQYEDALRELGCEIVQDLADVQEQDLMEIGLKKIEIVRLRRLMP